MGVPGPGPLQDAQPLCTARKGPGTSGSSICLLPALLLPLLLWPSTLWTGCGAAPLDPARPPSVSLPHSFMLKSSEQARRVQAEAMVMQEKLVSMGRLPGMGAEDRIHDTTQGVGGEWAGAL